MSRELDSEIELKLFGVEPRGRPGRYSTDIAEAWRVVEKVQLLHPGWRFSILGGDSFYPYGQYDNGNMWVDRSRALLFGWHARFFGGIDPDVAYPFSHGEAYAPTSPEAICRAALATLNLVGVPNGDATEAK